jgi:hypothetical protein
MKGVTNMATTVNKDYMLRTRLNPLEKSQVEILTAYYQQLEQKKISKARLFGYLVGKEFERVQMDIVELTSKI